MGCLPVVGNFVSVEDILIIQGKLFLGIHNPEGLTATYPVISRALLGLYAGKVLKKDAY